MTNDDLIRLDQRVVALEATVALLSQRTLTLEARLEAVLAKLDTLNTFYGDAFRESTSRLLAVIDKVSGATAP